MYRKCNTLFESFLLFDINVEYVYHQSQDIEITDFHLRDQRETTSVKLCSFKADVILFYYGTHFFNSLSTNFYLLFIQTTKNN
jgi:hypothetical protein